MLQKVQFDHFYPYVELEQFLTSAAASYPQRVKLETLAKTEEGRAIFIVKITDFSIGEVAEKRSAYYVQAGVHANEGAGTTAALHLIETLLTSPSAEELLKSIIFYIIPCVNPDGANYSITKSAAIRSSFASIDGLPNAIIPSDINGDGRILHMRWENPLGNMKDYEGTGIMVARRAGDMSGPFYSMCTEGHIDNYDGGLLQFGMRSYDINRSFPSNWLPMSNAEDYPCRSTETRAVAEFIVTHPNIFAGIDYHCGSCGVLRPTMEPDSELCSTDLHTIKDIGKLAEEMTGLPLIHAREYKAPDEPASPPYGCSNEWAYHALGISSYVIELGNGFNGIGLQTQEILENWRNVENGRWLKQILDRHKTFNSEVFVPWEKFEHPQLGRVEIGGFRDGMAYYMYPPDMERVIPRTTSFLLKHASMGPRLVLGNLEKMDISGGNYRIRVECMNIGRLGTTVMVGASGHNAQKNVYVRLKTGNQSIKILSRPAIYTFKQLNSMQKEMLEWFVKGKSGEKITVEVSHPKSGTASLTITL